jgi:hypothetical protein
MINNEDIKKMGSLFQLLSQRLVGIAWQKIS